MTTVHDSLCRLEHDCPCCLGREEVCDCDLIARVRAAERAAAVRDAVEAIKAIPHMPCDFEDDIERDAAIAAIKALDNQLHI